MARFPIRGFIVLFALMIVLTATSSSTMNTTGKATAAENG